jgi:transposase-like protein
MARRSFSREFKLEAVRLVSERGMPAQINIGCRGEITQADVSRWFGGYAHVNCF